MIRKAILVLIAVMLALIAYAQVQAKVDDAHDITAKVEGADTVEMSIRPVSDSKAPIQDNDVTASFADSVVCGKNPFNLEFTRGYVLERDGCNYNFYMSDEIGDVSNYEDMIKGLKALPEGTTVTLHLANFGGYVHTGVQIINAMKASKAHTIAEVEGPSYSMGALIACAANELQLHPYAFLMFHDYSGGFRGKGSESREMIKAFDTLSRNLMTQECQAKGILTKEQVDAVSSGSDIYIHPADIKR